MKINEALIRWYSQNKRDLPWRNSSDPYVIWLSEIILQQTRVEQGLPYFYRFLQAYPTLLDLAKEEEESILKHWQGLGYYSRARNMHATAKKLAHENKGAFPDSYRELLKLKGIGEYTAAAIASFAYGLPYPVVDGNVFRFLSRYYGIGTPINTSEGKKEFTALAARIMDKKDPALFNQAIMEFGSLQCKPRKPDCKCCPLINGCMAAKMDIVENLPVKIKTNKPRNRYFNYLFISYKDQFIIRKRVSNDIWKHLYEFPLVETGKKSAFKHILNDLSVKVLGGNTAVWKGKAFEFRHQLSHQTIHTSVYSLERTRPFTATIKKSFEVISRDDISRFAFPRLIAKYMEHLWGDGHESNS